jgi:nicotinamidase-related amidase
VLHPSQTALIIIDMQRDFLDPAGYIGSMGYDVSVTRRTIEPTQRVLARFRELGCVCVCGLLVFFADPFSLSFARYHIVHTREAHLPDLSDCPQTKRWRSYNRSHLGIGDKGPLGRLLVKGEPGWDIIPELYPRPSEVVIDKPVSLKLVR